MTDEPEPFDAPQSEPLFMAIPKDDPAFLAAYAQARASLPRFRELLRLDGDDVFHSAKLRFRDPDLSERLGEDRFFFLWVSFVVPHGSGFRARLVEVPETVHWLSAGEVITFDPSDVYDWMVNDNGRLFGGFTLRVNRDALPESRRAAFDRYVGVTTWAPQDA